MSRQRMKEQVINKYGLNNNTTLVFCEIADSWISDKAVKNMYDIAMLIKLEEEE